MNPRCTQAAADRRSGLLHESARRGTQVVVSHHDARGWQILRSRFVACDPDGRRLILSPLMPEKGSTPAELAPGSMLGVTFRHGHKKCMFSTALQRLADHDGGDGLTRSAVWVGWPDHVQQLQRRVYYRVPPPPGTTIHVRIRVQPGPPPGQALDRSADPSADRAPDRALQGVVENFSAGGMRVQTTSPGRLAEGAAVVVSFALRNERPVFELDAVCRHSSETGPGPTAVGLQFVGLEASEKGRETLIALARVVTEFHRVRARHGLPESRRAR